MQIKVIYCIQCILAVMIPPYPPLNLTPPPLTQPFAHVCQHGTKNCGPLPGVVEKFPPSSKIHARVCLWMTKSLKATNPCSAYYFLVYRYLLCSHCSVVTHPTNNRGYYVYIKFYTK